MREYINGEWYEDGGIIYGTRIGTGSIEIGVSHFYPGYIGDVSQIEGRNSNSGKLNGFSSLSRGVGGGGTGNPNSPGGEKWVIYTRTNNVTPADDYGGDTESSEGGAEQQSSEGDAVQQQNGGGDDLGRALSFASFGTGLYVDYMHNHKTYTTTGGQPRSIYRSNGAYRSARAAQFGQLSKFVKGLGIAGAIVSTGYSGYKVANQIEVGGVGNINPLDATDVGVGVIGIGSTILTGVG